jgi:hypothetical protein
MKTVTLRTLVRDPLTVKRLTRRGATVRVTDRGRPLWLIASAEGEEKDREQADKVAVEEMFQEVLQEPVSSPSLSQIIRENRR